MSSSVVLSLAELEQYDRKPAKSAEGWRFLCPATLNCQAHTRRPGHQSLCVNTTTGAWVCKRCGSSGKLREYWQERPHVSRWEQQRQEQRQAFEVNITKQPHLDEKHAQQGAASLRGAVAIGGTPGERYLASRGITAQAAERCRVLYHPCWRYCDAVGNFVGSGRPAVLFRKEGADGQTTAVIGRFIDDGTPKTKTYGDSNEGVFSTPDALDADPVLIVEGPMCALTLALLDLPAIAIGGTNWPHWLIPRLSGRTVIVATDADEAGIKAAQKLQMALWRAGCKTFRLCPDGGEHGEKDFNDLLQIWGVTRIKRELEPVITLCAQQHTAMPVNAAEQQDRSVCLFCEQELALPGRYECARCALQQGLELTDEEMATLKEKQDGYWDPDGWIDPDVPDTEPYAA